MTRLSRSIYRDANGSAVVEFGLIAPAFLLMLLGVFQIGAWMQAYNAMRNSVAEAAREVAVQYQTENQLSNAQIANTGLAVATTLPYMLKADSINVEVEEVLPRKFANAREINLELNYQLPSFLGFAGIDGPEISYSRTMFLAV